MRNQILKKIAMLVTSVVCLAVIFNQNEPEEDATFNAADTYKKTHNQINELQSNLHLLTPACEKNESAYKEEGFSALPERIQDYLLYRHCRSFPLLLDVPHKCGGPQNSADVFLLLVIKSSPENYNRREVLRKTWAEERLYKGVWIRRLFIIGTSGTGFEKMRFNKLLKHENNEHHDILQWDFKDTFLNLTLKQMLFLSWMERRCPNVRFLLNGDDDIFAHTFNMIEFLQSQEDNDGSKHLFVGYLMLNTGPIRHPASKYYVSVQIQQSELYPPYCSGGGFLLSGFTARMIHNISHSITLMPIDDVYMGMCLEKVGLKPESHFGIRPAGMAIPSKTIDPYDPCFYKEIILVHRFMPPQIVVMWDEIQNPYLVCGNPL